jgi:chemotaxis signal transduction protein
LDAFEGDRPRPIDPATLLAGCLDAPGLAALPQAALGEVAHAVAETPTRTPAPAFIVVEAGGRPVPLPREAVQELVQAVAWTPVPRAPEGFLGVGLWRGAALPLLSLAVLLGRYGESNPGGFVAVDVGGRRALLAVDRIVGLRFRSAEDEAAEPVDVAAAIPDELRRIVLGFPPRASEVRPEDPMSREAGAYLAFTVAGLDCAVAAECVDRIVGPQPLIRLPRAAAGNGVLQGAIELRGQILPVAALCSSLSLAPAPVPEARAYIIIRDAGGRGAIGVERVKQLVRLHPSEIVPAPAGEPGAVAGVVARPEGGLLRVIGADRLWSAA